ncbi:hypothetical protein SAMN05216367_2495 [Tardiphaga sp. OK245]|nr:hypothetical protein SAMN05216367_2495 [Tardiphaga sp. OK245]
MRLIYVSSNGNGSKTRRSPRPPHRRSELIERANRSVPVRIEFPHPLCWWRTRAAHSFKNSDIAIARCFLRKSAIIDEPRWHLAAQGNAAQAAGVALRTRTQTSNFISVDLAMTAVLCVALEGASTATFSRTVRTRPCFPQWSAQIARHISPIHGQPSRVSRILQARWAAWHRRLPSRVWTLSR